jgi:hypothetical protein
MRLRVFGDGSRQPGPVGQGTVVGTPEIGTLDGPKQRPTATQFGGSDEYPNTQSTIVQEQGWPNNTRTTRGVDSPSGARQFSRRTDDELQDQPAAPHITRQFQNRNAGYIGDNLVASFPYNAEWGYIPHQFVPRAPRGAGPAVRMVDDQAPIPAVYSGNPRSTQ